MVRPVQRLKGVFNIAPSGYRLPSDGELVPYGYLWYDVIDGTWNGGSHGSPAIGTPVSCGMSFRAPIAVPIEPKKPRTTAPLVQETSRQALQSQKDKAPTDCWTILSKLKRRPMTCDELESLLNMSHQTASARVRDLAMRGEIKDSGKRRNTRTGRKAVVWTVVDEGW